MPDLRLIEVDFPIRPVSEESVREKNIRHGHISTLHIWWARRPLAASRTTALAALLPDDPHRREALLRLVRDLAPYEAVQGENPELEKARALIREAFGGRPPRVLDPFAGGGSIPLEALRLGCEVHALDYNPVAVLILKCVLEYPQRYAKPDPISALPLPVRERSSLLLFEEEGPDESPLLRAVRAWGAWVLEEARRELQPFYPPDPDGSVPVGYIWARTLPCQNPACGVEIPLMRQTWLAKKDNRKIALRLVPNRAARRVDAEIVEGRAISFDPEEGTVTRAHVRCPLCGGSIDGDTTRRLFREGKAGQRMMAVVLHHPDRPGKRYRLPTARDLEAYRAAEQALEEKRRKLWEEWGMDPVPDEPTPIGGGPGAERAFSVHKYGLTRWGDLFNARQKLALLTFADKVRQAHAQMRSQSADPDFAKAVVTYMALTFNRLAASNNALCRWQPAGEKIADVFSRQALSMIWDYAEPNPFGGASRSWDELFKDTDGVLAHLTRIPPVEGDSDG
jgi:adenine-specific DNA methylase